MFKENRKKLFRKVLKEKNNSVNKTPNREELEGLWKKMLEEDVEHNPEAQWIDRNDMRSTTEEMNWLNITSDEVKSSFNKSLVWKTPGPDGIPNYWLKKLTSIHKHLANCYNELMQNPEQTPFWLANGQTTLIPKNEHTDDPKNYRPITCLNTIYKNLTSIISERLYQHLQRNNMLPYQQK